MRIIKRPTKKKFIVSGVILMLCAIPLFAILGALVAYCLPHHYYSKVTMELKNEAYAQNANPPSNPLFIQTQLQLLRTKDILDPVIANLHLADKLTRDHQKSSEQSRQKIAYLRLQKMLDLRSQRNTQLIDIGVYANDPQLASDIANEVAEVYKSKRDEEVKHFANSESQMFDPAHIWEKAVPDPIPAKPHIMMIILLGAIVGIPFAIVGFVLLLVGLCSSTDDTPLAAATNVGA